jgi:hypothetical protein
MLSCMPDSFCTDCGAPLVGSRKFCAACGTKAPEGVIPRPSTTVVTPTAPTTPGITPLPAPPQSSTPQPSAMSREAEAEQRRRRIAEVERQRQADAEEKRFMRWGGIVLGLIIAALLIYQGTRPTGDQINEDPCVVSNNCDDPALP